MSKIMVVEDDASLREIYSIRITAEGYDVVSAGDGEEALAMAVREKPDLILSDVMMPKISGFDMLDIIRSTPEIADIKVIMMTALSADDQRQRGERLGADRYLVKSQVGIEDVINAIHEVLGDKPAAEPAPIVSSAPIAAPAPAPAPVEVPAPAPAEAPAVVAAPAPVTDQAPVDPAQPVIQPTEQLQTAEQPQAAEQPVPQPIEQPQTAEQLQPAQPQDGQVANPAQ